MRCLISKNKISHFAKYIFHLYPYKKRCTAFAIKTPMTAPASTSVGKCTPRYSLEKPISAAKA